MANRTYLENLAEFLNEMARTTARSDSHYAHLTLFKTEHSAAYHWLKANRAQEALAASLWADLHRYGRLTSPQMQALEKALRTP